MEHKQYKILLVDDDTLNHRMMGLLLSGGGYSYESVYNGAEAVAAVQTTKFDLILMDLQMPIMDGYEATQKIRAWEAGKSHVPIIALSAMILDNETQLCLETGMDGCIVKPFNTEQLFHVIDLNVRKSIPPKTMQELKHEDANILLNIQTALPRFGSNIQTYREFLTEFLQTLPEKMEQFRALFISGDFHSLSKNAHNLKGVAASMGAMQLSVIAARLEQQCRNGETGYIEETLEECAKNIFVLQDNAMKILSKYPG